MMNRRMAGGGGAGAPGYAVGSQGSHLTTRPANTGYGANVTCYQNAFTAYTAVGSALATAATEMMIRLTDGNTATAAKDTILRVGVDLAGGSSFTAIGDFLVGPSSQYNVGGSYTQIWLPYAIPAGATVGMVGSVNNATPGTLRASVRYGGAGGGSVIAGTAIESVGLTLASSSGTAVTQGQAAEGAWTLLGTLTYSAKYMGVGCSIGNGTINGLVSHLDLSYSTDGGATKILLIEDQPMISTSSETVSFQSICTYLACQEVPAGATIYGRAQCSGAPDAGFSMAAWAVR